MDEGSRASAPPACDSGAVTDESTTDPGGSASRGPRDIGDVDPAEISGRSSLGSMIVPAIPGLQVQVQADQKSGVITQVTFALPAGAVQVHPYAAPRSGGLWEEVRAQLTSSINSSGGLVEEREGPFGIELVAQVKDENGALQPARFVGVEGPRWFVRGVFIGGAARDAQAALELEEAFRQVIIVRGEAALPVGAPLPLRLPDSQPESVPAPPNPFVRGPEITETR